MIFITTFVVLLGSILAKLSGLLVVPWGAIFSVVFIVPLVYVAIMTLQLSAIQYIEDWDDGE